MAALKAVSTAVLLVDSKVLCLADYFAALKAVLKVERRVVM